MTERLHLAPKHRAVIEALLREHLPGVEVWAYGSRVDGRSHDGSDLDLGLRGPGLQEIPVGQVADFEEAVRESSIPFLVEARDWAWLPERFHREIERGYVVLVEKDRHDHNDWQETCWGDIATLEYGRALRGYDIAQGPFRVFGTNGPIGWHDKALCEHASVIVGRKGAYRGVHYSADPSFVIDTAFYLKPKVGMDVRWAYYALLTQNINEMDSGSAIPSTSREEFYGLPVSVPPLSEQRAIAHILGTLDDKIELNRRMNETLEAMARALFKSWFVDFDPVRAKAVLRNHAVYRDPGSITPPLRGSRGDKGASPQSSRWGEPGAPQPPRPWPDIKRQYTAKALHHAQAMRQSRTNAEGLLWHYLRNKQLGGYKFRRQQPIGPYIADFACLPEKLLIELDGGQHADPNAPEEQRDQFLRQQGYQVLRFWNHEVFADCFSLLERVYEALTDPPPLQPAPDGLASTTPPQGGSDWSVARARTYLDGMDPEIAALFPDRFVDSELGEIPAGWEVDRSDGHISAQRGLSYKGVGLCGQDEGMPMHNLNSIFEGGGYKHDGIKHYKGEHRKKHVLKPGDLIVTNTEQGFDRLLIGHAAIVPETFGPAGLYSHHIYRIEIRSRSHLTPNYLCQLLNDPQWHSRISGFSNGTTINMLPMDAFEIPLLVIPPAELVDAFTTLDRNALMKMEFNRSESRALAALRDALLPRLISGALRLRDQEGGPNFGSEC